MNKLAIFLALFLQPALVLADVADVQLDKVSVNVSKGEPMVVKLSLFDSFHVGHAVIRSFEKDELYLDVVTRGIGIGPAVTRPYELILHPSDYQSIVRRDESKQEITLIVRSFVDSTKEPRTAFPVGDPKATFTKKFTLIHATNDSGAAFITDPSGTWYQPSLSGTGFVVMQYQNGTVVQYYGYDADGGRLWLLSDVLDKAWVKGETQTLTMYEGKADSTTGFTNPPANAPGIDQWGTLELQFNSCSKAKAKLQGIDGEQSFDLERLAGLMNVRCTD